MIMWKKLILVSVLALFSIANSFESIHFLYKQFNPIAFLDVSEFDCEENTSESEKSNEKTEKQNYFNDNDAASHLLISCFAGRKSHLHNRINFSSSDYSQVVYSPPEFV